MAASRSEISKWFDAGVEKGASYMIIFCDTYDYDDYPSYFDTVEEANKAKTNLGNMIRYMESYDLKADKETQLNTERTHCL